METIAITLHESDAPEPDYSTTMIPREGITITELHERFQTKTKQSL